jgi:hypothetical protein
MLEVEAAAIIATLVRVALVAEAQAVKPVLLALLILAVAVVAVGDILVVRVVLADPA